jgi:hypothetical protein
VEQPERDNPALVRALVAADVPVIAVGEVRHSLEAVYLELVRQA